MPKQPSLPLENLMRDFLAGRETPALLAFQAQISEALAPLTHATDVLVHAIAAHIEAPNDEATKLAMTKAKAAYEAVTGELVAGSVWDDLQDQARSLIEKRRTRPPKISDILKGQASEPSDLEYDIAGTLGGIRGIWHRLWSSISAERLFGQTGTDIESIVPLLRQEFEQKLGRALTAAEWSKLTDHAHKHCDEVMIPFVEKSNLGKNS